ncbi:uncharacterized protein LOC117336523 [Pecten maximus]|uniref:uncharacterized protein LOC117336523 n=1 Tax=Pecten maximus TaxID=6579 RepID=UPI0014582437|nr:uncharacterized protein LOC117336523 [Pecten maximus]
MEKTIYSLITHSTASQQMTMVVIIFMVDRNQTWTKIRSKQLSGKYPKFIQNGFLQIVHQHDQSIYPDFTKLKRTFNDSAERVAWRSKQNIDYAYLFLYSENISRYYLHLEDDVIAAGNYYNDIVNFIGSKFHTPWYYLEFSHIGFIGKLLRSSDLCDLSDYMMMFFAEQPCDLLLIALGKIKTQSRRILHQDQSSNTLVLYNYFCGVSPKKGRYFRVVFDAPQNISHLYIHSGTEGKESDALHDANLLVSTSGEPCKHLTRITNFTNGVVDTKSSNMSLPVNIDCIAIEITADHNGWVIIREIAIFLPGEVDTPEPKSTSPSQKLVYMVIGKQERSFKPHTSHGKSNNLLSFRHSREHTASNDLGQNNVQRYNESRTWTSPMSYESDNVNSSNSSVKHFERERDAKQSSDMNLEGISGHYTVKQQYDSAQQKDGTQMKFNSTGLNKLSRKKFRQVNPPATIYTQIETYSDYKPVYAYDSSSDLYFWGVYPKKDDYILILLNYPQNISRIFIDTGYDGKESDILHNARLLVSSRAPGEEERRCHSLEDVGTFQNGDIDTKIPNTYTNIDCFVIEITANQRNWVIIREIAVFMSGESETTPLDNDVKFTHTRNESNVNNEEQILERGETSDLHSKLSNGPGKDNGLALLLPQQRNSTRIINRSSLHPHQPKEGFLPDLLPNRQQTQKINIQDWNITGNV